MTATKNPTPDEMAGAEANEDPAASSVRQLKKARRLRWGHQDETDENHPGFENLSPEEQSAAGSDHRN